MILRDYQQAAVDAVVCWTRERQGEHPLTVIPTGGGKTAVMAGLVQLLHEADPSARALILAHRRELLAQAVETAWRILPSDRVGIYSDSMGRKDTRAALTVAGIQSLQRDPYVLSKYSRPIDRVLVDECHLVPDNENSAFRKTLAGLAAVNPHVQIIGLTATPYRMGTGLLHEGDNRLFAGIAYEAKIPDLLAQGYLSPLRPLATRQRLSTSGVQVRGDYVPAQLAAAVDVDTTTAAIVTECVAAFHDRVSWLVFGVSLEHCEHLAAAFRAHGVSTQVIHGKMSASERSSAIAAHKSGAMRCAVSCDLLTTGYDHPQIDAIAMCRPTKSAGLYYQMVGRGFRIAPGKVDCLVLDFAGNVLAHGPVDTLAERIGSRTKGDGIAPAKECPGCAALLATGLAVCPTCGHAFPPPAPPKLETVPSERPLLSTDVPEPSWADVSDVVFSKTAPNDGRTPTLRVDYMVGAYVTVASEWLGFDHTGFARSKAVRWWRDRFPDSDDPVSVSEALEWLQQAPAMHYTPVAVSLLPDGKYQRVVGYRWPDERAGWLRPASTLPRACWTCRFFGADETCSMADPLAGSNEPPDWIKPVGCEDYALMSDADDFAATMREGQGPSVWRRSVAHA
jgi:DNA repair protein RadD